MPAITVSGIILYDDRLLALRDGDRLLLPGGPLLDDDDSVEEALCRVLGERLGLDLTEPDYLETLYERRDADIVVHNIFFAGELAEDLDVTGLSMELQWVERDAVPHAGFPEWLAEALPVLLAGEEAPLPDVVLDEFGGAVGAAPVVIITGPAGAGKSTVARELCTAFERAAHIEVDEVHHMIVTGRASPVDRSPSAAEWARQRELATRNTAALARNFATSGITAVIDDVLESREELDQYLVYLGGMPVFVFTLLPDVAALRERDAGRPPEQRMGDRCLELHRIISANGEDRGLRLDTSAMSVDGVVNTIIERLDSAMVNTVAFDEE